MIVGGEDGSAKGVTLDAALGDEYLAHLAKLPSANGRRKNGDRARKSALPLFFRRMIRWSLGGQGMAAYQVAAR